MQLTLNETFLAVLAGLVVLSIGVTGLGNYLGRRTIDAVKQQRIALVNSRLRASWSIVAVFSVAFALGTGALLFVFAVASFFALRNFVSLTPIRPADHWALVLAFYVVTPLHYVLIGVGQIGLFTVFIPVYVFLLLPVIAALRGDVARFMERVAELQWGLMIAVYCLSYVPALLTLPIPGFAAKKLLLVAFFVLVVQASDVLQYIWGKLLGRHRIAPHLSPSKTVEGFLGGIFSATALGAALWWLTPFSPAEAALMALVITLLGFCGGLVMSALKRDRGVKDWGWLIAGHGGMLDRLDSVIFAAPIFFHLTRYWWTP